MSNIIGSFTRIKDLSDKRRLPRLGKIRLGVKAVTKTGKEFPREVNHFVVPLEVSAVYGEKPTELDVMFPLNDIDTVFPQAYKFYGSGRGLKCVGNGESAMRLDETTQTMKQRDCPCDLLEQGKCQRRAHLMVMLPTVSMGGVYQIDLGSYHSIVDINSGMDFIQALVGRFAMVPLKLKRVARETHNGGKKTVHYPLQIVLSNADVATVNALRDDNRRVLTAASRLALAPPEDCNPQFDDGATVAEIDGDGASAGENNGQPAGVPYTIHADDPASNIKETGQSADAPDFVREPKQEPPRQPQSHTPPQPPKGDTPTEKGKGEGPANTAQQSAIIKLATKAGIEEDVVLQKLRGMSMALAATVIVSLQRGDKTVFATG